jgi:hypothetical protein
VYWSDHFSSFHSTDLHLCHTFLFGLLVGNKSAVDRKRKGFLLAFCELALEYVASDKGSLASDYIFRVIISESVFFFFKIPREKKYIKGCNLNRKNDDVTLSLSLYVIVK